MELAELTVRMALSVSFAVVASAGAVGLYEYKDAAATCDNKQVMSKVYEILRDEFHIESIFINDIRTISGGLFSDAHLCSAEFAPIRGNVNASDMPWREVRYQIKRQEESEHISVTVKLGGDVPLARPTPSLWSRLFTFL